MLLNIPKGKKYKQINLDLSLILYTKINSKGILDLNVKHAAIKLLGKQIKKKKKSLGSRARQRILRPDTKSAIHKMEKLI